MPSFNVEVADDQILLRAAVLIPGIEGDTPPSFDAIVDTGSQITMISERVVESIGAESIGRRKILPVSGTPLIVPTYWLGVFIPITLENTEPNTFAAGRNLEAAQLPYEPSTYDILLGMDLLIGFHITMYGGQFILSN
ncbi:MAG: hypothetical protein F4124_12820 [Acidimicrobiia bacterium]|nr:hypothetical protein [Acidimicrobiia bacterium]MYB72695.1 hypothetical protein [Acidimicrobiia bacterium]MYI00301.1 hypothetical protein [Acidimicrobiia bacterium]